MAQPSVSAFLCLMVTTSSSTSLSRVCAALALQARLGRPLNHGEMRCVCIAFALTRNACLKIPICLRQNSSRSRVYCSDMSACSCYLSLMLPLLHSKRVLTRQCHHQHRSSLALVSSHHFRWSVASCLRIPCSAASGGKRCGTPRRKRPWTRRRLARWHARQQRRHGAPPCS